MGDATTATDYGFRACVTNSKTLELRPLDMMVALDVSGSMDNADPSAPFGAPKKWNAVSRALHSFVKNEAFAGLGVGLRYFPAWPVACKPSLYTTPSVAIADLPANAEQLGTSLDHTGPVPGGKTPIVPVMEGLLSHMQQWAKDHPDRKAIIVLATDGIPDESCLNDRSGEGILGGLPNSLENAVSVTSAGAHGNPGISTFVIGVGKELT